MLLSLSPSLSLSTRCWNPRKTNLCKLYCCVRSRESMIHVTADADDTCNC